MAGTSGGGTNLPNGLVKGWTLGAAGYKTDMDNNFCKLDAVAFGVCVSGQILSADLPAGGNQGEQYYLTDTNEIATYQGSVWIKCPAKKGLPVFDSATGLLLVSNGASLVEPTLNIPTATEADILAGVVGLYPDAKAVCDSLNSAFTGGISSGTGAPVAAPASKELPFYIDLATDIPYAYISGAWVALIQETTNTSVGVPDAAKIVETDANGCIDRSFITSMNSYPDETSFLASKGLTATLGMYYFDTTLGKVRVFDGTQWVDNDIGTIGGLSNVDPAVDSSLGDVKLRNNGAGLWVEDTPALLIARHVSGQVIPTNVYTKMVGFTVGFDTAGTWDAVNSQYSVPTNGWYDLDFRVLTDTVFTVAQLTPVIRVNGVDVAAGQTITPGEIANYQPHVHINGLPLATGDIVEFYLLQSSGSNLAMSISGAHNFISIHKSW